MSKKCLNIMKHHTLVSTIRFYLNLYVVTNKSYKTKNYMLYWCVYFLV